MPRTVGQITRSMTRWQTIAVHQPVAGEGGDFVPRQQGAGEVQGVDAANTDQANRFFADAGAGVAAGAGG